MSRLTGRPHVAAPAIALLSVLAQPGTAVGQEQPAANAAPAAAGDAAAKETPFDVMEFRVLGNTTLPQIEVERAVYPHLGPNRTFATVEAARQSLETAYRSAGYATVFVDIPEQRVEGGVVRLRVTEGKLDRIRVTGARYFANSEIREQLPSLTAGQVPKLAEVQQQLAEVNRATSDRSVTPVLRAGRTPGTVDIELKVEDKLPAHASLEVSDRYSANTSRLRLNASLSYDNLFQRNQSLSLQYQTAPQERDDVEAFVGSYVFRVPTWRTAFAFYGVDSKTNVAALGTLSVLGNGQIFGFRAIRSLPDGLAYSHNFTFGLDYKDFLEDIQIEDSEGLITPITYMDWSVAYAGTLRGERSTTGFSLGANFGIRGLMNDWQEFADKRFKARPNYMYVNASLQQARMLPAGFQIYGRVGGQYSGSPLVSNEQYSIGGAETVRGYLESSQLGDYGFSATLEVRNAWIAKPLQLPPGSAYMLVFYDAGVVAIHDPLQDNPSKFDLSSYGLGMRVEDFFGLSFAVDWARALDPSGTVERGDDRVHFSVRYAF